MKKTQLKLNRMRKYQTLVNKKREQKEEGQIFYYKLEGNIALEHLHNIEAKLEEMRTKLKNDRTQRWRSCVGKLMGTQKEKHLQMDQRKDRQRTTHSQ
eukprot:16429355-Heterocapsa_arctica.AAC.2